jgi:hypothetical protein
MQKLGPEKNEYFKPNRRTIVKRVILISKDSKSEIAKGIFFSTLERSIYIILTRPFENLTTGTYFARSIIGQKRTFSSEYLEV